MDNDNPVSWVNGILATEVSIGDRGLAYGDGIFETVRVHRGVPTLFDLHCNRLSLGAAALGIPLDVNGFRQEASGFLQEQSLREGVLKAIVTRGSGGRGYNPVGCDNPSRILSFHPLPVYQGAPGTRGVRLHECKTRMGDHAFAGLKHLNRLENVMARAEWQGTDCLEGLLLGMDNRLLEGTMSNLFLVSGQTLRTPCLRRAGVKGVCRDWILAQAGQWGLQVSMGDFRHKDLAEADEVFVCNSVNGVWPVVACGGLNWSVGTVTCTVRDRVVEVLNV